MTKADLIKVISSETGIIRKDAAVIVDSFLNSIKESLVNGKGIEIRGFGTFKVKRRAARMARNPKKSVDESGKPIYVPVPERYVPTFKFSRAFKEDIAEIEIKK